MALFDIASSAKESATGAAGKAAGAAGGIFGGADILEGGGLDKASAAAGEIGAAVGKIPGRALDVLRGIFGGLPWEMGGQEVADAAQGVIIDVAVVVI